MKTMFRILSLAVVLIATIAVSARAQVTLRSTTLGAAVNGPNSSLEPRVPPDQIITVASTTGVTVGMVAFVLGDLEAMTVKVVNSSTQLTVTRGTGGTVATPHASGATIYIDLPGYFVQGPLTGPCTSTSVLVLPTINVKTGFRYDCVSSLWVTTGGPTYSSSSPTISSPTITGHATIEGVTATGATGTGNFVFRTSPTLITPVLGVATGTSLVTTGPITAAIAPTTTCSGNIVLPASKSGSITYFDQAAGCTITLPTAAAGLVFDFIVTVSVTSNADKILTGASQFFIGAPLQLTLAAVGAYNACNGTTAIDYSMNGTTTGGLVGTWIRAIGLSATQWQLIGYNIGSGSLATACSAS